MKKHPVLINTEEPTDKQLSDLMKEVAQEAKRKALISDKVFFDNITQEIKKLQNHSLLKKL
jgi:hypothetical protein